MHKESNTLSQSIGYDLPIDTINKSGRKTKNVDLFYTEVFMNWTRQFENFANLKRADVSFQTRNGMVYVNLVNRGTKSSFGDVSLGFSVRRYHENALGVRFYGIEPTHAVSAKDWQTVFQSLADDAADMFEDFKLPSKVWFDHTSFMIECDYTSKGFEKAYRQIEILRDLLIDGNYGQIIDRLKNGESLDEINAKSCEIQENDYEVIDNELHLMFCTTVSYNSIPRELDCEATDAEKKKNLSEAWTNKRGIVKRAKKAIEAGRKVIAYPVANRYIDFPYEVLGLDEVKGLIHLDLGEKVESSLINKRYVFERRQRFEVLNPSKIH